MLTTTNEKVRVHPATPACRGRPRRRSPCGALHRRL